MSAKFTLDYEAFGEKLKKKRVGMGLSQEVVAEKCNISVGYYSNLERGKKMPSVDNLIRIANCLDLDLNHLFGNTAPVSSDKDLQTAFESLFRDKTPAQSDFLTNVINVLSENKDKL